MIDHIFKNLKGLLLFYIIISGNFLGELLSCDLRRLFNNRIIKHILGIITLFISVTYTNKINNIKRDIIVTFILYLLFITTTKTKLIFSVPLLISLLIIDIFGEYKKVKNKEKTRKAKIYVTGTFFIINVISIIYYLILKKQKYKDKFSLTTFFIGHNQCNNL